MGSVVPLFPDEKIEKTSAGTRVVAALDIGSVQVACLIGEVRGGRGKDTSLRITGHAVRASRGVKAGVIVDPLAAERAIRLAVDAAERMAGTQIDSVWVNLSGGRPVTHTLTAELKVHGKAVKPQHVDMLIARALASYDAGSRLVVQLLPAGFSLDGGPWIASPTGLLADEVRARVNVVSMQRGPLQNLEQTLQACQLGIAGLLSAPVAAAEATLTEDERELGALVVDIGAAQTSWAAFCEGMLLEAGVVPVGGHHITCDIAAGLHTPIAEAERLKTVYGSVLAVSGHDEEILSIPVLGENGPGGWQSVSRASLQAIIAPRMEELLEMTRQATAHLPAVARQRVIFTGGGAQLSGLADLAEKLLSARVRVSGVRIIAGLPPRLAAPAHATVAGLLHAAIRPDAQGFAPARQAEKVLDAAGGYLDRMKQWFRESF